MTSIAQPAEDTWPEGDRALLEVGRLLQHRGYGFTTITPASHARVLARAPRAEARTLRDVFGWNRPFRPEVLGRELFGSLVRSGEVERDGLLWRSRVRFSTVGDLLVLHSAYPTEAPDSVFLGPDTYRFCALLDREVPRCGTAVDVGCGSGIGGLVLAARSRSVVLSDPNGQALRFSRINAVLAGVKNVELVSGAFLDRVEGSPDVVVANPPYLVDPARRQYRHGGEPLGTGIAEQIARRALERLRPGGLLVLYTGSPVVAGVDGLRRRLEPLLEQRCSEHAIRELDPDVFGEELESPAYADVERIALLSVVARLR